MSQAEKAPYEKKVAKRKAEYEKLMDAYNKNLEGSDESEKYRSEVNDEDEASEEEAQLEKGKARDEEEDDAVDNDDDEDEEED